MLIGYIKMPAMLKQQWFEDNKSDAIKLGVSKHLCINKCNNKKEQDSEKYQSKGGKYVFLFILSLKKVKPLNKSR